MSKTLITKLDGRNTIKLKDVAERLGDPISTVRRWAMEGKIPGAFQIVGKGSGWRFKRDVIEHWYETRGCSLPAAGADPRPATRSKAKRKAAR